MVYYVYFIKTLNTYRNKTYVGYTNNLKKRLTKHNASKGAKFTRGRKWILAYSISYDSKSKAMREEYKLKKNYKLRNKLKSSFL